MGEKNSKDPESELTVNCNDVTYQYTNRNVSINKLFCMYTNADCLSNELNKLKSAIDSCDTHPHLIGACETKPKTFRFTPSATEFLLPGYSLFHSNVDTQIGRGVSLYISNILTATPIVLSDEFCESVWVTLTGSNKLLIGSIYHSPTQQCDLNNARLCNMLLSQSAYRPGHSTEKALLKVVNDQFLSLNKGNISVLALLDFSSAFDTIDHTILVHHLHTDFGFTDTVLQWFSY